MDMTESISVIITAYNYERYLAAAIESVLTQTRLPDEVIVVDDGSVDGTAAVAQQFGRQVRYDFQPHGGIGAARNRGLQLAGGRFLAFLDADDQWTPNKLDLQARALGRRAQSRHGVRLRGAVHQPGAGRSAADQVDLSERTRPRSPAGHAAHPANGGGPRRRVPSRPQSG